MPTRDCQPLAATILARSHRYFSVRIPGLVARSWSSKWALCHEHTAVLLSDFALSGINITTDLASAVPRVAFWSLAALLNMSERIRPNNFETGPRVGDDGRATTRQAAARNILVRAWPGKGQWSGTPQDFAVQGSGAPHS